MKNFFSTLGCIPKPLHYVHGPSETLVDPPTNANLMHFLLAIFAANPNKPEGTPTIAHRISGRLSLHAVEVRRYGFERKASGVSLLLLEQIVLPLQTSRMKVGCRLRLLPPWRRGVQVT